MNPVRLQKTNKTIFDAETVAKFQHPELLSKVKWSLTG